MHGSLRLFVRMSLIIASLAALAHPTWAQQLYEISGTVKTPSGVPIYGAETWIDPGTYGYGSISVADGSYVAHYIYDNQGSKSLRIAKNGWIFDPSSYYLNQSVSGNLVYNFLGVPEVTSGLWVDASLAQGAWSYYGLMVPSGATRILVNIDSTGNVIPVAGTTPPKTPPAQGLRLMSADYQTTLTIDASTNPPISPGLWYIGIYGYSAAHYTLQARLSNGLPDPTISGRVFHSDGLSTTSVAGAIVSTNNGGTTTTTDAAGLYQVTVPYDWTGQVSVSLPGARFLPVARPYAGVMANLVSQDFQGPQYPLEIISDRGNPQGAGWYDVGSTAKWSVTSPCPGATGVRSVTTTPSGTIEMTEPRTITIAWATQYLLSTFVDPPGSGSIDPPSIWFAAGSTASVAAQSAALWNFDHFGGALSGAASPQSLLMDGPKNVTASFNYSGVPTPTPTPIAGQIRVPQDQATIQAAIDAAVAGNEIVVAPNTYRENIYFKGKNITLRSTNPTDPSVVAATIIDGSGSTSYAAVRFSGAELASCVLTGFTITKGNCYYGGGVYGGPDGGGTQATISHCVITQNTSTGSDYGGGLWNFNGILSDDVITSNTTSGNGGGLNMCNGKIRNCFIAYNTAGSSGGGMASCDDAVIENCVIYENSATNGSGGGVYFAAKGQLTNCTIYKNHANGNRQWGGGLGGGVACWPPGATLKNCILWDNTGNLNGTTDPIFYKQLFVRGTPTYSCIQDYDTTASGCITADPQFLDAAHANLQLASSSPCIDTGRTVSLTADIRGIQRPFDGDGLGADTTGDGSDFDMGAYEYANLPPPGEPVLIEEPAMTRGIVNTVYWHGVAQAAIYDVQCAATADFAIPQATIQTLALADISTTCSVTFQDLVDGPYWYRVRAENASGNPGAWSASVSSTQDGTAPGFNAVMAQPSAAWTGRSVRITFAASETLAADPTVRVNNNPVLNLSHTGNQYACDYTIQASDPLGPAAISIAGMDQVGYHCSMSDSFALNVVVHRNDARNWGLYE